MNEVIEKAHISAYNHIAAIVKTLSNQELSNSENVLFEVVGEAIPRCGSPYFKAANGAYHAVIGEIIARL
jgi:hypothetical protein